LGAPARFSFVADIRTTGIEYSVKCAQLENVERYAQIE